MVGQHEEIRASCGLASKRGEERVQPLSSQAALGNEGQSLRKLWECLLALAAQGGAQREDQPPSAEAILLLAGLGLQQIILRTIQTRGTTPKFQMGEAVSLTLCEGGWDATCVEVQKPRWQNEKQSRP